MIKDNQAFFCCGGTAFSLVNFSMITITMYRLQMEVDLSKETDMHLKDIFNNSPRNKKINKVKLQQLKKQQREKENRNT